MSCLGLDSSGLAKALHGAPLPCAAAAGASRLLCCAAGAHAGLASGGGKVQHSAPASTADHSGALGTSFYISPEIANGWAQYDEKVTVHFSCLVSAGTESWWGSCLLCPAAREEAVTAYYWLGCTTFAAGAAQQLALCHHPSLELQVVLLCLLAGALAAFASNMEPQGMCDGLQRLDTQEGFTLQVDLFSLSIVAFELWHPFTTGMERIMTLRALQEDGTLPEQWAQDHPQVCVPSLMPV